MNPEIVGLVQALYILYMFELKTYVMEKGSIE